MKNYLNTVNVLGVPYSISTGNTIDFPDLSDCDGYCDNTSKVIVVCDMTESMGQRGAKKDLIHYQRKCIRHELVHAFLFESGLAENCWAKNEETVDWIAAQFPKLAKAFEVAECLKEGD